MCFWSIQAKEDSKYGGGGIFVAFVLSKEQIIDVDLLRREGWLNVYRPAAVSIQVCRTVQM